MIRSARVNLKRVMSGLNQPVKGCDHIEVQSGVKRSETLSAPSRTFYLSHQAWRRKEGERSCGLAMEEKPSTEKKRSSK
jgi:hypothetical protein